MLTGRSSESSVGTGRVLRLVESRQVPFYTPHIVMLRLGLLEKEGYSPTSTLTSDAQKSVDMVLSGEADIAMAGPLRTVKYQGNEIGRSLVNIAHVNCLDGFFVLSRREFDWPDLEGKRLIVFGETPNPWLCLRHGLRRQGLDPNKVQIRQGLKIPEATAAFEAGEADFIQTVQPVAELLLASGAASAFRMEGPLVGPLPFSSYITKWRTVRENSEMAEAFLRAYYRALRYVHSHSPAEIAQLTAPSFPDLAPDILQRILGRFLELGNWPKTPLIDPESFDNLQEALIGGGWIPRKVSYEESVAVDIVRRAVQAVETEDGPLRGLAPGL